MSQIPTIPEPKDLTELVRLLNDRLRRIGERLTKAFVQGEDIDLQGFRVKNISPAIEATDAVSRVESDRRRLMGAGGDGGTAIEHFTARYAPQGVPPTGTDVANNHFHVSTPAGKRIRLTRGFANAKVAPSGTFAADWEVSTDDKATWNTVFSGTTLEIATGDTSGEQTGLAITTLNHGDYVRINISSHGSASGVECKLEGVFV